MEDKKMFDVTKFKIVATQTLPSKPTSIIPKESVKKLEKGISITAEDGRVSTALTWFSLLEDGANTLVQCPLAPELHHNGDANPSCSMKRYGNYLSFNCFGCDSKASIYFGKPKDESKAKKETTYTLSDFNKNEVLSEVKQGLNTMQTIVDEMVRLLPALEKSEKKDD